MEPIFICYRREDSATTTGRIREHLVRAFGADSVFTDVDSIPLGVDFRKHLDGVVGQCKVLIAIIGRDWLTEERRIHGPHDFVRIEIESALRRDIPVIPVLVRSASMPSETDLPATLADFAYRNASQVRPDPDFRSDMARLIQGIEQHLRNPPSRRETRPSTGEEDSATKPRAPTPRTARTTSQAVRWAALAYGLGTIATISLILLRPSLFDLVLYSGMAFAGCYLGYVAGRARMAAASHLAWTGVALNAAFAVLTTLYV